jgi:hypothetical protein
MQTGASSSVPHVTRDGFADAPASFDVEGGFTHLMAVSLLVVRVSQLFAPMQSTSSQMQLPAFCTAPSSSTQSTNVVVVVVVVIHLSLSLLTSHQFWPAQVVKLASGRSSNWQMQDCESSVPSFVSQIGVSLHFCGVNVACA